MDKLEEKTWYRLFKVFAVGVIGFSFFSPLFLHFKIFNSFWVIDGIINVAVWTFIFWVLKKIIVYVLYGKKEVSKMTADENFVRAFFMGLGLIILVIILYNR